ncbi:MAG TPA: hypothetical protein DEQ34_06160 [Balneolaceae bacterium]|nr:hypothetical protein [Balneolaceae bacterium]|tara:strand:+ start:80020 stop:81165 length:1146 start_codon:yes stop_codon:yes gene_type:complete
MKFRLKFIVLLFLVPLHCDESGQVEKELSNLTTFELGGIPEIVLQKEEAFNPAYWAEVNSIGDVAADSAGSVYFVDVYKRKIQVSDSNGKPVGTIGRAGSSPGEFRKPTIIGTAHGDLFTFDDLLQSAYRFSTKDRMLKSSALFSLQKPEADSLKSAKPYSAHLLPGGNYLVGYQVVHSPEDRRLYFYETDEYGALISDQILAFQNKRQFVKEDQSGLTIMMMPYERETFLAIDSEGKIYTVFNEDFVIKIYDRTGKYLEAREYPVEKLSLNESDALELFTETMIRRAIRGDDLPKTWPAVTAFMMDDKDRIWAATYSNDLNEYRWYVLSASGKVLGTFLLPSDISIEAISGDYIIAKFFNKKRYRDEIVRYSFTLKNNAH